ncbi:hypothetical protein CC85DRAFT_198690 [Cutaneotrichosporon oleaginosum]|uniref:Uncharacterized protein n=1 Tax=Cutaneotrichosporon oleaginosum TaxID=879819 RepID=A0A0J0XDW9_9TREE|nr:uncharacterized protein CC85DRAFT_198690 [Cutaneotrichosporon oleaginosum]KLT39300.1 hypothetical protein CC85DRAFT_198690 [Cutaneotrichosporon oleaginosum]TXT08557.1 hypothetical protein COLE_05481 [Cutaneotrichosporon oleaginosum]
MIAVRPSDAQGRIGTGERGGVDVASGHTSSRCHTRRRQWRALTLVLSRRRRRNGACKDSIRKAVSEGVRSDYHGWCQRPSQGLEGVRKGDESRECRRPRPGGDDEGRTTAGEEEWCDGAT